MKLKNLIEGEYARLEDLCGRDARASWMLDRLYAIALKQEKEHRALGARFTRGRAAYKHSAALAAKYFAVHAVLSPVRLAGSSVESALRALAGLREDYVQGAILAAYLRERGIPYKLAVFTSDMFEAIDYARDFGGAL